MRKAKRGPALFELLSEDPEKNSESLKVPTWWAGQNRGSGGRVIKIPPKPEELAPDANAAGERADERTNSPRLAITGGSLNVSLTSTTAAIVVFVGIATLLAAFEIGSRRGFTHGVKAGRASYVAEAASEIEFARKQKPATHIVASLLDDVHRSEPTKQNGGRTDSAVAATTAWIRDYTYIVAQEFSAGRSESAAEAQAFLQQHGIETAMVLQASGSIQLITTQGFNHRDPAQKRMALAALDAEHKVGGRFYAQGGGYRLDGYFKTLKGDRW